MRHWLQVLQAHRSPEHHSATLGPSRTWDAVQFGQGPFFTQSPLGETRSRWGSFWDDSGTSPTSVGPSQGSTGFLARYREGVACPHPSCSPGGHSFGEVDRTSEGKWWCSRHCRGKHCQEGCGTDHVPTAHGVGAGRHSTIPVCDVNQEWVCVHCSCPSRFD